MVVDTSALVAILLREPDATVFEEAIAAASVRLVSAVSRVELSFVIEGRKGDAGRADLETLLREGEFEIAAGTPNRQYSRSVHSARMARASIRRR